MFSEMKEFKKDKNRYKCLRKLEKMYETKKWKSSLMFLIQIWLKSPFDSSFSPYFVSVNLTTSNLGSKPINHYYLLFLENGGEHYREVLQKHCRKILAQRLN